MTDFLFVDQSEIVLTTSRTWLGDQRLGTFVVYLDGERAGVLPPQGTLRLKCPAGRHRLRARQWWYRSEALELDLAPGQEISLAVDIIRQGPLLWRMLSLMVRPGRGVTIQAA